jgi:large subunit ribosomal protein L21
MSTITAVILGILIGWVIEWIIDWIYWRRKAASSQQIETTSDRMKEVSLPDHSAELAALSKENASLKSQLEKYTNQPDDLKIIKGIGPEIEKRLNRAGVTTFAQLGEMTPADLERILGETIKRLADEDSLLEQARELARIK